MREREKERVGGGGRGGRWRKGGGEKDRECVRERRERESAVRKFGKLVLKCKRKKEVRNE